MLQSPHRRFWCEPKADQVVLRPNRPVFKPSQVMRLVKAKKMPHSIKGGTQLCCQCSKPHKADTESPTFHENGTYIYCKHCKANVLYIPIFPPCEGYPLGFEIDLTGERKKYPLAMDTP